MDLRSTEQRDHLRLRIRDAEVLRRAREGLTRDHQGRRERQGDLGAVAARLDLRRWDRQARSITVVEGKRQRPRAQLQLQVTPDPSIRAPFGSIVTDAVVGSMLTRTVSSSTGTSSSPPRSRSWIDPEVPVG
jgi:hypothetical protein